MDIGSFYLSLLPLQVQRLLNCTIVYT